MTVELECQTESRIDCTTTSADMLAELFRSEEDWSDKLTWVSQHRGVKADSHCLDDISLLGRHLIYSRLAENIASPLHVLGYFTEVYETLVGWESLKLIYHTYNYIHRRNTEADHPG